MLRPLHLVSWMTVVALGAQAASAAALNERDRAAIEAVEQRLAPVPARQFRKGVAPLAERMAEMHVPAVSIAFIENGRVKWARAYGEATAGSGRKATPETRFQAASMSKAVAAAAALRMADQGRLSLDEDVNSRLRGWQAPSFAPQAPKVTLRRLLSHTAGLTVDGYPGYRPGEPIPTAVESLSGDKGANTPAVRAFASPGAQLAYSGGGYTVAQLVMSEAAGTPFPRLTQTALLRPAGMTRSGFDQPLTARTLPEAASGHDTEGKPLPGGSHIYPELAAAGLWTTPSDYGRFLIALQNSWAGKPGALLKPETAKAMMTPVAGEYGLGIMVLQRNGRTLITHGGTNEGFQCRFVAYLGVTGQGVVVMTNGENGGALAAAVQRTLSEAYGWDDALGPPPPRAPAT